MYEGKDDPAFNALEQATAPGEGVLGALHALHKMLLPPRHDVDGSLPRPASFRTGLARYSLFVHGD
jgi:hypothetical protein